LDDRKDSWCVKNGSCLSAMVLEFILRRTRLQWLEMHGMDDGSIP